MVLSVPPSNLCNCSKGKLIIVCLQQYGLLFDGESSLPKMNVNLKNCWTENFLAVVQCGCSNTAWSLSLFFSFFFFFFFSGIVLSHKTDHFQLLKCFSLYFKSRNSFFLIDPGSFVLYYDIVVYNPAFYNNSVPTLFSAAYFMYACPWLPRTEHQLFNSCFPYTAPKL